MTPPHTPPRTPSPDDTQKYLGNEANSVKRAQFFDAYDNRDRDNKTTGQIYHEQAVKPRTGRYWRYQRRILGFSALRRTRKQSTKLERPEKVSKAQYQFLVSTVRDHALEEQIAHYKFQCSRRTFQTALRKYTRNAGLYKKAWVKKFSRKNKKERVQYGYDLQDKTIDSYLQFVWFSDEGHIDGSTTPGQRILRN
jgi:hypothetical protein